LKPSGPASKGFAAGEPVFGMGNGSLAGYLAAATDRAVHKPERVTFEEAAAVPLAGLTALQALRDKALVRSGHHILIVGAAGGIGHSLCSSRKDSAQTSRACKARPRSISCARLAPIA